jgi:hypothetical protein
MDIRDQCYKTYHYGNIHGNTVTLCYKALLPCNGCKLQRYCFTTLAADKTVPNTTVIYCHILTLEEEGTAVNYHGIFITLATGVFL